jgi:hypothetical protein
MNIVPQPDAGRSVAATGVLFKRRLTRKIDDWVVMVSMVIR